MTDRDRRYSQLMEEVTGRRSVRFFSSNPVSAEDVEKILEAGRWAPSPGNRQPWRFILVPEELLPELEEAVSEVVIRIKQGATNRGLGEEADYLENFLVFSRAPAIIAVVMREPVDLLGALSGEENADDTDQPLVDAAASTGAVIQNMLLACHALGLAGCWITGPLVARSDLENKLDVPRGWRLAALIAIGHPANELPEAPERKTLERLIMGTKGTGEK